MILYFDASALAKRYVEEAESSAVRRLLRKSKPATSRLSAVEIASAAARRCREGELEPAERDRILAAVAEDFATWPVIEVTPEVVSRAISLLARHPLRAADALQLASCLLLQERLGEPVPFLAFDRRLIEAGRGEGLEVSP